MTAHALSNATHVIRPHCWQAYGYCSETRLVFASAVRASNVYMARSAVAARTTTSTPVITYLEPIPVMAR